jgi:hypothetical protein
MTQAHDEPTYRDLIAAANALYHAGAHPTDDEDTELRAAITRLLAFRHSTADPHDMDAIRQNAQLL